MSMGSVRGRAAIWVSIALMSMLACSAEGFTGAPDEAVVSLSFPDGRRATQEDSLRVVAELRLETGDLAGPDWRIDLSAARGRFGASGTTAVTRLTTDEHGTATVMYYAPADTGWVRFTAVSGAVRHVDSVYVAARPPAPTAP